MKYYHQIEMHDPENGRYGDCVRTCIGCLLDLEPASVPNFAAVQDGEMWDRVREWLAERGFALFTFMYGEEIERQLIFDAMKVLNPGQYYMLFGASNGGIGHVVICLDDHIEYDPSWTQISVVAPLEGRWAVMTIVPLMMVAQPE